jgi:hypothetical protein
MIRAVVKPSDERSHQINLIQVVEPKLVHTVLSQAQIEPLGAVRRIVVVEVAPVDDGPVVRQDLNLSLRVLLNPWNRCSSWWPRFR